MTSAQLVLHGGRRAVAEQARAARLRQVPVLGPEDLVDLGPEELGHDPRLVGERGLDLARDLLELVAHELGVDRGLLALEHPRADLDRVDHDARRRPRPPRSARSQERGGRGIVDDDVLDDHPPHQDVDAGLAEGRGGFHGERPRYARAPDGTLSAIAKPRRPSGSSSSTSTSSTRRRAPGRARTNVDHRVDRLRRALEDGLDRAVGAVARPARPRRGAPPPGASSRGRRRPARARERPRGGGRQAMPVR